jgi:hypothetical protein
MNDASSAARPRRFPLQFSLRLLLLAFTAFAIGFPIWYRWPYEEEIPEPGGLTRSDPFTPFDGLDPFISAPTGSPTARRITTWQRQWGGGRLKHGVERLIDGENVQSTTYVRGKKHGPYADRDASEFEVTGQYVDDMKEETWIHKDSARKRTFTWHRDLLDGPYEIETVGQPTLRFTFTAGRLTHFNGQPARNRLFDLLEAGQIDKRTARELRATTSLDPVEMQLRDLAVGMTDLHNNIPLVLDPFHIPDKRLPITERIAGVDLCSALTLVTAPHDLGCDYRYGCVWITSAEDAEDWRDPTGVAEIQPPKGSDLARAWNEPGVDAFQQPLAEVLAKAAQPLAIEIDTSQIAASSQNAEDYRVSAKVGGLPFRHALGFLLYMTRCRCKLEGDKLVILPPEEMEKP